MDEKRTWSGTAFMPARRQLMVGAAIAWSGLALGQDRGPGVAATMPESPDTAANKTRTALHQEVELKAKPQRVYATLLDSIHFSAFSGAPAQIQARAGGRFVMFGGMIVGRNVELVPDQRIVQAWRPTHWDPGVYSMVKFELQPRNAGTVVVLDHTGFPEGEFDSLSSGWQSHYWDPLRKFFA